MPRMRRFQNGPVDKSPKITLYGMINIVRHKFSQVILLLVIINRGYSRKPHRLLTVKRCGFFEFRLGLYRFLTFGSKNIYIVNIYCWHSDNCFFYLQPLHVDISRYTSFRKRQGQLVYYQLLFLLF